MFVSVARGALKPGAPACRSKQWSGGVKSCRAQYQVILRRFWDEASSCLGTLPREVGSHDGVKCGGSGFADSRMLICMKRGIRNSTYRHLGPTQNPCWRQTPCRHGRHCGEKNAMPRLVVITYPQRCRTANIPCFREPALWLHTDPEFITLLNADPIAMGFVGWATI